ncbi:unnamed protein product, partial [Ranitomeya imitator]
MGEALSPRKQAKKVLTSPTGVSVWITGSSSRVCRIEDAIVRGSSWSRVKPSKSKIYFEITKTEIKSSSK